MRLLAALCLPMLCAGTTAGGHAIRGRPAVRRAGNLVTTAGAAQLRGLTVAFRRPPLMDPYCARGAGGLSTLLLLLPGLVARRRGDARRARWFGIQTAIAFISDYVMIGALSICHGIDRLCASYTFASLTLRAYRGRPTPPQRSAPQQGAPAGEAPRARPRLVRVGCLDTETSSEIDGVRVGCLHHLGGREAWVGWRHAGHGRAPCTHGTHTPQPAAGRSVRRRPR